MMGLLLEHKLNMIDTLLEYQSTLVQYNELYIPSSFLYSL